MTGERSDTMKIGYRYIFIFTLPILLLMGAARPANAALNFQCNKVTFRVVSSVRNVVLTSTPLALKTAGGWFDPNDPNNLTTPTPPLRTSDPGCQVSPIVFPNGLTTMADILAFRQRCLVDIDPVTEQPSGKTVDPATGLDVPDVVCRSLTAGDGHVMMADRDRTLADPGIGDTFIFGFSDITGIPTLSWLIAGSTAANHLAPTLFAKQNQDLYLNLTNVSMRERPDLTDPHTVHYHGFPNASSFFDGEPMASIAILMGNTLTYYYNNVEPGTYIYHCHVEAAEHMQMGMLGQLFISPAQDGTTISGFSKFAYNDCTTFPVVPPAVGADSMCGTTGYNVLKPLEITSFDPDFHLADNSYNALNFADMTDSYTMFNGRGYPDTVIPFPVFNNGGALDTDPLPSQPVNAHITISKATQSRILLRFASLATVDFYTVTVLGIPMRVVGQGARILRGPDVAGVVTPVPGVNTLIDTTYNTTSVTIGGGEANDLLLDVSTVPAGTYFMYTTNLNNLSNNAEDFGGMMTEIVVTN
jgi:FtsP/CotA-like multicopper oxidase with cupredoxin domain